MLDYVMIYVRKRFDLSKHEPIFSILSYQAIMLSTILCMLSWGLLSTSLFPVGFMNSNLYKGIVPMHPYLFFEITGSYMELEWQCQDRAVDRADRGKSHNLGLWSVWHQYLIFWCLQFHLALCCLSLRIPMMTSFCWFSFRKNQWELFGL